MDELAERSCCDGHDHDPSDCCGEDGRLPDFIPDPFPTQLPFERWRPMELPPILFTRWRYPKFVREQGSKGAGGQGGEERALELDGTMEDGRATADFPWPFRCERPQVRMEVSSLAWRPRYSEKVKTHRRGSTRAVVTPTERVRPFQPFASRHSRRRRVSVTF